MGLAYIYNWNWNPFIEFKLGVVINKINLLTPLQALPL